MQRLECVECGVFCDTGRELYRHLVESHGWERMDAYAGVGRAIKLAKRLEREAAAEVEAEVQDRVAASERRRVLSKLGGKARS